MAAKRDRLGRGLGALLGEYLGDEKAPDTMAPQVLPVGSITPNPYQPRREFVEQELADLAASIRENGLLQPIVVRPSRGGTGAEYELVAGERRWRSVTRLGWADVPAIIKDVDDRTLLVLALVENLQRAQLSPLEEAEAFKQLADEFSLTQQQIAETVGRDRSTVANALRLLQLPASVRQLMGQGKLTAGHARALLGLNNERWIIDLAREAAEHGWSVREVENRVQKARPGKRPRARVDRDVVERELEEALQRALDTPVRIRRARAGVKGRIEIPFFSAEDFERIFEHLARRSATDVTS